MNFISKYLADISSRQTRRAYQTDLRQFFGANEVEEPDVCAIEAATVQSFVRTMSREGRSMSTQRRRLAAIRGFFDWLLEKGVVTKNPARHPDVGPLPPESEPDSPNVLSAQDVGRMIETAGAPDRSGHRDQALILTIVYGALRRREVAELEVGDVRPLGRHWILDLDDIDGSSGYVRVPGPVVEAIERMKDRYGITEGRLWRSVSTQNRGAPMTPDAIYKVVRRVSERADLEPVSIDTLRRTGLQLALEGGADVSQIQAHGRFANPTTAARLYDTKERSGILEKDLADYIDLDLGDVLLEK